VRTIGSVGAPVGLQLWSLRSMSKEPGAMLRLTRSMGITHVETAGLYGLTPQQFADSIRAAGLRVTSMHVGLDAFKKEPQKVIAGREGARRHLRRHRRGTRTRAPSRKPTRARRSPTSTRSARR
jgi:hypothetical protein